MNLLTSIPVRTILSESRRRAAFRFWLSENEHPNVMISGSASVAAADEVLAVKLDLEQVGQIP